MELHEDGESDLIGEEKISTSVLLVSSSVLTPVVMARILFKMAVFRVVVLCRLVRVYQRFRGHNRPDDGGSTDL
jgi:hypothetical protein